MRECTGTASPLGRALRGTGVRNHPTGAELVVVIGELAMQTVVGMILGAVLLALGVYAYDSTLTSNAANNQVAQTNRTIVNWDVVASDWHALKSHARDDWVRISSK
jgi:hypothetical protein